MAHIDWTPVEEATKENTVVGYQVGLLEAVKILDQRLKEEKLPGRTTEERLDAAELHFTRPKQVRQAIAYVTALRTGTTNALTVEGAKKHLQALRQAVADLNDLSQSRANPIAQAKMYLGLLKGKQRWLVRGLVGIGAFFLTVLILADTAPGQLLVALVVTIVNTFFSWIITLLILLAILVLVILGTAVYLDRRKGGTVTTDDDHHH